MVITHSKNDVNRTMLCIYMRVLFPNGSATIGMYAPAAIHSQNTSAKECPTKKHNEERPVTQTQDDCFSSLYMRVSNRGRPVEEDLYLLK